MSNNAGGQPSDFESVKNRLAEIADAVDDENLLLDDALDLYEEAVALGLKASDLLEAGIIPPEEAETDTSEDDAKGTETGRGNDAEAVENADSQA